VIHARKGDKREEKSMVEITSGNGFGSFCKEK
jgi:hypothetical protein